MNENFYILIAKFTNGERIALTFDTAKAADNYHREHRHDITQIVVIKHEFGKVTLIHDCTFANYRI